MVDGGRKVHLEELVERAARCKMTKAGDGCYWAARPMPSLRIASTGASIESARTIRTPCGSASRDSPLHGKSNGADRAGCTTMRPW